MASTISVFSLLSRLNNPAGKSARCQSARPFLTLVVVVSLLLVLGNVERSIGQIQSELSEDQQMFAEAERAAEQLINMVSDENTVPPRLSEPQIAYLFSVAFRID